MLPCITSPPVPPAPPDYIAGLDLGQAQDFTALSIVEQTERPHPTDKGRTVKHFAVRHLQRWPLGTEYTAIIADLKTMAARPPLPGCPLVTDATGVGKPIVEMLRKAELGLTIVPVTIHGGHAVSPAPGGGWSVPKKDLVAVMQASIQANRFKISPKLADAVVLGRELQNFKVKVTLATGKEVYESWRERDHDDLVLSVALACWYGQYGQRKLMCHIISPAETQRIEAEIKQEDEAARAKIDNAKVLGNDELIAAVMKDLGWDADGSDDGFSEWDAYVRANQ